VYSINGKAEKIMEQQERIWLKNYPSATPADIDMGGYESLADYVSDLLIKFKDLPAYESMGKTITYAEVDAKSKAFAAFLQAKGLKAGDKIAFMMLNLLQYPIAMFGALRAGLIIVNTNPLYTAHEIKHQFNDANVTAVLVLENFAFELEKIIKETPVKLIMTTSIGEMLGLKGYLVNFVVRYIKKMVPKYTLQGAISFSSALSQGAGKPVNTPKGKLEDTICIQYTGGTTGVAKGAELTNKNLIANMLQVREWIGAANLTIGKERMLTPLPMYHIFSFTVNCLCMATLGAMSILVVNPRDQKQLVDTIKKTRPTLMTGVNTLFNALLNNPDFCKIDFKTLGLKLAVGGAMAIQKPVAEKWQEIVGIPLTEGFGMTESSPVLCVNLLHAQRIGTIGLPVSSTYIRIADIDTGLVVATGERGEIQAKGPQVMKGYYNRPEETAKTMTADGWLRTGDIGIMDENGFVSIVDRLKNMILVSGFNVYPNEIEDVLAGHPKIMEAAAIGVPDAHSGELIKIFVVKKEQSLTEEEVKNYCRQFLTGYKNPKYIEFRDELPKTNVGKILHRTLRDEELAKRKAKA
jgi:long-chain acyl-CoA synthetase